MTPPQHKENQDGGRNVAHSTFAKLAEARPIPGAKYIDAHTHIHFAAFTDDYRDVVNRAAASDVHMIAVGTQKDTSKRAIEVAHEFRESVWATVGLHPIHTEASFHDTKELGASEEAKGFTSRGEEFDYKEYKKLAADPKVVAIGECGLDYYRLGDSTKKKQMEVFEQHLELAHEVNKPLMIHCRHAFDDLIHLLSRFTTRLNDPPGVIHFFTGTREQAMMLMDLGFAFTFGGVLTFTCDYDNVVRSIPLDRIFSETDAPYVAPVPYRGKRNEPAYIVEVVKKLAEIKGITVEEMRGHIFANAKRIFKVG
jgi:TatD DNase family protein